MRKKGLKKLNKIATENSALITKSIHQYLQLNNKMPSLAQISDDTGISRQTVSKHLQGLKLPSYLDKYKELTDDVMQCLLMACKLGSVPAIKLYMQLVWKWKPPKIDEPTTTDEQVPKFIILSESENKEHQNKESNTAESEPIPLNRKIQQQKESEMNLDSGFGVSDAPPPIIKGLGYYLTRTPSFHSPSYESPFANVSVPLPLK